METRVQIADGRGRRLTIRHARFDGEGWQYEAELRFEGGRVTTDVWDHGRTGGVADFAAELAAAWRGFDGELSWSSIESQLAMRATHDGLGQVRLTVTLGQPSPPTWSCHAEMELDAGADLARFAGELGQRFR